MSLRSPPWLLSESTVSLSSAFSTPRAPPGLSIQTILELCNVARATPRGRALLDRGAQSPIDFTLTRHHAASLVPRRGQSGIPFDLFLTRAWYMERQLPPI